MFQKTPLVSPLKTSTYFLACLNPIYFVYYICKRLREKLKKGKGYGIRSQKVFRQKMLGREIQLLRGYRKILSFCRQYHV